MLDWWELPGPSRFLEDICRDLVSGVNVIAAFPEYPPEGFRRALRRKIPTQDGIAFDSIRVEKLSGQSPCSFLFSLFLPDDATTRRTPNTLAAHPVMASRVIWIEQMLPTEWPAWRCFFEEFQRSAHAAASGPVFCVPLVGPVAAAGITINSPCMRLHRWSGCVKPLDLLLYVSERIPGDAVSRVERDTAVSVVANLALWDPHVADRLLVQPLAAVLNPGDTLAEIARERGWPGSNIATSWESGIVDRYADTDRKHSAWLAAAGDLDEIARRVWRGQVSVLFPFIEERRLDVLDVLLPHLILPLERTGPDGVVRQVTEARRLEMADLSRQISSLSLAYVGEIGRLVRQLRRVRNSLAHFARQGLAVRAEELSGPEIRDWRGVLERFQSQSAAPIRARSATGRQS